MALGLEVSKPILDMKSAQAVLQMRSAFDMTESIAKWLQNHPVLEAVDPLVNEFGYASDEAYTIRQYFEGFDAIRINNQILLDVGRKMTGLE